MKYIKYYLVFFITAMIICSSEKDIVYAEDEYSDYEAYLYDAADLLTDEEEDALLSEMEYLLDYGNMVFQTVELNTSDYEDYAEHTYYELYGNQPGVLFQIDMGNRKLTLSASTDMERMIGHERDSIVDNIYEMATDGDYYGCASECFYEIETVLEDGQIAHRMKHINNAIMALILGLLLNFIYVFMSSQKKLSAKELLGGAAATAIITETVLSKGRLRKEYSPVESSDSGGSSSGGGGGFSGGSSSHGF